MEKGILLAFMLVCHSHQRPSSSSSSSDVQITTEKITAAAVVTEPTVKVVASTPATVTTTATGSTTTAISVVQTSLNVSGRPSFGPSPIFDGFKPNDYHWTDGNAAFEQPSQPGRVAGPQYLTRRPDNGPPKPVQEDPTVFPRTAADQEHRDHSGAGGRVRHNGNDVGFAAEPRSPYAFDEVLPQYKPVKHDSGGDDFLTPPNFVHYDNGLYDRHFGQQYPKYSGVTSGGHYSAVAHDGPPKSSSSYHHSAATRKKKDPWRSVLSVLATILPVGLLLASFPPTVIKVNSTQYPYQFQKNATLDNPVNVISGRYKALRETNAAGRKINDGGVDESPGYLDDCLKNKICENMKTNYSPKELGFLLQNDKLNWTRHVVGQITKIVETAASASPDSCRAQFVCND